MWTPILILTALLLFPATAMVQEPGSKPETAAPAPVPSAADTIPASAVNEQNPVHPTLGSQARAKQLYNRDCAMCHGEQGDGKGDITTTAKMLDFRDPASLKPFTDGTIFYIITNGKGEMPPETGRATAEETWNMVIYLRSFSNAGSHGST